MYLETEHYEVTYNHSRKMFLVIPRIEVLQNASCILAVFSLFFSRWRKERSMEEWLVNLEQLIYNSGYDFKRGVLKGVQLQMN